MSTIFSCTRALSYALLWLLQSGVYVVPSKSNWKKKPAGQVSKQKRKEMRGLFLVAKAKWSLAWTGFCPSTTAIRDIPHCVFICKGASFSNIKQRCILLKLVQSCLEKVFGKRLPFEKTTFSHGLLLISNLCRSCDSQQLCASSHGHATGRLAVGGQFTMSSVC